jgi:hypothetical protein
MQVLPGNQRSDGSPMLSPIIESNSQPLLLKRVWLVAFLLLLAATTLIRIRLLDMPLERDEGEFAYAGQLLLEGVPPYQEVYTMKWPGTHMAYALIMAVFGQTARGIHAGLILVTTATVVLVFVLGRRLGGEAVGAVAGATYALMSSSPPTDGLAAHATHFVILPALAGILLVQAPGVKLTRPRVFLAGLLLGLGALMKQPGLMFGVFAAIWLARCEFLQPDRHWRRLAIRLGYLALGGSLPFFLLCFVLIHTGTFDRFWFWTVMYARAYGSIYSPGQGLELLLDTGAKLFKPAAGLWSLAGLGLLLLLFEKPVRPWRWFLLIFLFFSFLAVSPGCYFRRHYFILLMPAAALLAGVAIDAVGGWLGRFRPPFLRSAVPLLLFAGVTLWSLVASRAVFFQLTPREASRAIYPFNPFPETVEIGNYLAAHCPTNSRIALLASEPEIFFYSHRRSATGYIYMYPLMEPQPYALEMQKEMIAEIEKSDPDYFVFAYVQFSWLQRPDSESLILDWFEKFRREHLTLDSWVEILSAKETRYHWSVSEPSLTTHAKYWLAILKKNRAAAPPEAAAGK